MACSATKDTELQRRFTQRRAETKLQSGGIERSNKKKQADEAINGEWREANAWRRATRLDDQFDFRDGCLVVTSVGFVGHLLSTCNRGVDGCVIGVWTATVFARRQRTLAQNVVESCGGRELADRRRLHDDTSNPHPPMLA